MGGFCSPSGSAPGAKGMWPVHACGCGQPVSKTSFGPLISLCRCEPPSYLNKRKEPKCPQAMKAAMKAMKAMKAKGILQGPTSSRGCRCFVPRAAEYWFRRLGKRCGECNAFVAVGIPIFRLRSGPCIVQRPPSATKPIPPLKPES